MIPMKPVVKLDIAPDDVKDFLQSVSTTEKVFCHYLLCMKIITRHLCKTAVPLMISLVYTPISSNEKEKILLCKLDVILRQQNLPNMCIVN